jgi:hypothetical protein
MKLAFGSLTPKKQWPPDRVAYFVNTDGGSSGSPCLAQNLAVAALHHWGSENDNRGVLISAILSHCGKPENRSRLIAFGLGHLIGEVESITPDRLTSLLDDIETKHPGASNAGEIPIEPNLLALLEVEKRRCRERDVAFFTPNLLLALFGPRTGIVRRLLDRTCPGRAEGIVAGLRQYEPVDGATTVPFADFAWHDRDDVQAAERRAKQDGRAAVDGRYLLLGFLDTDSRTRDELRQALGNDGFERFAKAAETLEPPGTPGVQGLLTRSQRQDGV